MKIKKPRNNVGKDIEKQASQNSFVNIKEDLTSETTDPFGSYTGNSVDPFEKPIQDADDL